MNTKKSKTALKKLGITADELLTEALSADGDHVGSLVFNKHMIFWEQVDGDKQQTTRFMTTLLQKLKSLSTPNTAPLWLIPAIMNTITYICLNLEFNAADKRFDKARQELLEMQGDMEGVKEALRRLKLLSDKEELLTPIVSAFSLDMLSVDEIQTFPKVVEFPTTDPNKPPAAPENALLHRYIKTAFQGNLAVRDTLFSTIAMKLSQLPQIKKSNSVLADLSFLVLVQLFNQIVAVAPMTDRERVSKAINGLRPCLLWPKPLGTIAKVTTEALHMENMCPGKNMRSRLSYNAMFARAPPSITQDKPDIKEARVIYYFNNEESVASSTIAAVMDLSEVPDGGDNTPIQVSESGFSATEKAMLVLNMMHAEPSVGAGEEEAKLASQLTLDEVNKLWEECTKVDIEIEKSIEDEARVNQIRISLVEALKASLKACKGGGNVVTLPADAHTTGFVLSALPFVHALVVKKAKYTEAVLADEHAPRPAPITPFLEPLRRIFTSCQEENRPVELRLVMAGGTGTINQVLCAYCHLNRTHPKLFLNVRVLFFVVPMEYSLTAAYLARYDPWYKRHVYAPFVTQPFLLPWSKPLQLEEGQRDSMAGGVAGIDLSGSSLPGKELRYLVEDYVNQRRYAINFRVWQVSCWLEAEQEGKDPRPDKKIPFLEKFALVAGENSAEVQMSMFTMDYKGNKSARKMTEPCAYKNLDLYNVPSMENTDKSFAADPSAPWLEMCAVPTSKGGRAIAFATDTRHHVSEVDLTCFDRNGSICIVVDGHKWGPFHRVQIKSAQCLTPDGTEQTLSLPVATFFPTNLL